MPMPLSNNQSHNPLKQRAVTGTGWDTAICRSPYCLGVLVVTISGKLFLRVRDEISMNEAIGDKQVPLERGLGVWQATALNISNMFGFACAANHSARSPYAVSHVVLSDT